MGKDQQIANHVQLPPQYQQLLTLTQDATGFLKKFSDLVSVRPQFTVSAQEAQVEQTSFFKLMNVYLDLFQKNEVLLQNAHKTLHAKMKEGTEFLTKKKKSILNTKLDQEKEALEKQISDINLATTNEAKVKEGKKIFTKKKKPILNTKLDQEKEALEKRIEDINHAVANYQRCVRNREGYLALSNYLYQYQAFHQNRKPIVEALEKTISIYHHVAGQQDVFKPVINEAMPYVTQLYELDNSMQSKMVALAKGVKKAIESQQGDISEAFYAEIKEANSTLKNQQQEYQETQHLLLKCFNPEEPAVDCVGADLQNKVNHIATVLADGSRVAGDALTIDERQSPCVVAGYLVDHILSQYSFWEKQVKYRMLFRGGTVIQRQEATYRVPKGIAAMLDHVESFPDFATNEQTASRLLLEIQQVAKFSEFHANFSSLKYGFFSVRTRSSTNALYKILGEQSQDVSLLYNHLVAWQTAQREESMHPVNAVTVTRLAGLKLSP